MIRDFPARQGLSPIFGLPGSTEIGRESMVVLGAKSARIL